MNIYIYIPIIQNYFKNLLSYAIEFSTNNKVTRLSFNNFYKKFATWQYSIIMKINNINLYYIFFENISFLNVHYSIIEQ